MHFSSFSSLLSSSPPFLCKQSVALQWEGSGVGFFLASSSLLLGGESGLWLFFRAHIYNKV